MNKQKPVWRMNTGAGVPSDRLADSRVLHDSGKISDTGYNNYNWSLDDFGCYPITAYQTTRTKAAKYERKDCFFCSVVKLSDGIKCCDCNGKGYRLEAAK